VQTDSPDSARLPAPGPPARIEHTRGGYAGVVVPLEASSSCGKLHLEEGVREVARGGDDGGRTGRGHSSLARISGRPRLCPNHLKFLVGAGKRCHCQEVTVTLN
jgi:hypothetical protein